MNEDEEQIEVPNLDKFVDTKSKLNVMDWVRIGISLVVIGLVLYFYFGG